MDVILTCALFALVVFAGCAAVWKWRLGVVLTVLVGMLQDPVRKLSPGQPGWIQMAVVVVLVCSALGWAIRLIRKQSTSLPTRELVRTFIAGGIWLLIGTAATLARLSGDVAGSTLLLGLLGPSLLVTGLVLGSGLADSRATPRKWLMGWVVLVSVFLAGHLAEQLNPATCQPAVLGPLPPHRPWYHTLGTRKFPMATGLFRSPENAGWFAAMVASIAVTLFAVNHVTNRWAMAWPLLGGWAGTCCLLSARRKMQCMALVAMILASLWLFFRQRRDVARRFLVGGSFVLIFSLVAGSYLSDSSDYIEFFSTSLADLPHRAQATIGLDLVTVCRRSGMGGWGLGTMAPGGQHAGLRPPVYVEGGLLRVAVETGWCGLIGFLVTTGLLFFAAWRAVHDSRSASDNEIVAISLFSCLVAQFSNFLFGHQVYGDPLVLITIGLMCGLAFSASRPPNEFAPNP